MEASEILLSCWKDSSFARGLQRGRLGGRLNPGEGVFLYGRPKKSGLGRLRVVESDGRVKMRASSSWTCCSSRELDSSLGLRTGWKGLGRLTLMGGRATVRMGLGAASWARLCIIG